MKHIFLLLTLLLTNTAFSQNDDAEELFPFTDRSVGYLGYRKADKTVVVKPMFCSATYEIEGGYYLVSTAKHEYDENGRRKERHIEGSEKYALLNRKGEMILGLENNYTFIEVKEKEGIFEVSKDRLRGFVDKHNKILIPIEYKSLDLKNPGFIIAVKNKSGVINLKNEIVIPFEYDGILDYKETTARDNTYLIVRKGNKFGVIDRHRNIVTPFSATVLATLTDQSVIAVKNNKFGLVSYDLKNLLPFEYEEMNFVEDNNLHARKGNYRYTFSTEGKLLKKEPIDEGEKSAPAVFKEK